MVVLPAPEGAENMMSLPGMFGSEAVFGEAIVFYERIVTHVLQEYWKSGMME